MPLSRPLRPGLAWALTASCGALAGSTGAAAEASAPLRAEALPPPATVRVDFQRDIQPLLERSCLRCHGPERPKSNFRLDQREFALKGGSTGTALVVSNSASSPLVHYVARSPQVDEDLWMPPEGKAPALTPEEVALVRAWIDQGLAWGTSTPPPPVAVSVSPTLRWSTVAGNERVFREHRGFAEGWDGGIEHFELRQAVDDRTRVTAEGHVLKDDYRFGLRLERRDLGFLNAGAQQYRKYYADSGGYVPGFVPSAYSLDRDLHVDLSRAWIDLGLTLPHWPRLTLGYEHQLKEGDKSLTSWSPVTQAGVTRYLFPANKALDEEVHLLKFNLDYELQGFRFEDDLRAEWGESRTSRASNTYYPPEGDTFVLDRVEERHSHFNAANAFRLEKQWTSWLFASGGYLYNHYDADASFSLDEKYLTGSPGFVRSWRSPNIILDRDAHVANLNSQFTPWPGFAATFGLQSEWNRQRGFGHASFDYEEAGGGFLLQPSTQHTAIDRALLTEHVSLRYARIPATVLFAEGRWQQESTGHFEEQFGGEYPLQRDTDTTADRWDVRAGFSTSPWRSLAFSAHYRRADKRTNYDHVLDIIPSPYGNAAAEGYSAFVRDRDTTTDEVEARLTYHWTPRWKTSFTYRLVASDYSTTTDPVTGYDPDTFEPIPGYLSPGARILAGDYDAHVYSFNVVTRPVQRLSLNTTFSLHDVRTITAPDTNGAVPPYEGNTWSVLTSATYTCDAKTDLLLSYSFSLADYSQDLDDAGLRLGVEYDQHALLAGLRRRLSERVSATLRYGFFLYDEPSSGGYNDYRAHSVFTTVSVRL